MRKREARVRGRTRGPPAPGHPTPWTVRSNRSRCASLAGETAFCYARIVASKKPTVIIRACPEYDTGRIQTLVGEALDRLELRPRGRTLVKPNVVASGPHFPHAYTRPEFLEGVLGALKERAGSDTEQIAVGERSGITMSTRYAYTGAGYYPMARRVGDVEMVHFDEVPQVEIPLRHASRLRDAIYTPAPVAAADFFVNCPKFKAHPWTTVTFSMKNYIGIQDDSHRLVDHDHRLNEKIRDLQYIVQPQFIAIDAITAGEGRMLTPIPFDLGLVIMGDNQLAFDTVCCHIIGVDPRTVEHLAMAYEEGFGPIDIEDIQIEGDVSLEEAKKKAAGFKVGLIPVDEYFEGTNIKAYGGPPPPDGGHDYCWGGCPGALEEAIEVIRLFDPRTDEKLPRTHIVFGGYDGPIDAKPGEKVVFMGDCARYDGQIAGKHVQIKSKYVDRGLKDPVDAPGQDIFAKMLSMQGVWRGLKKEDVAHITGCPVSVAEQVLLLVKLGKLKNPYLDPGQALRFTSCYFSNKTRNALKRVLGLSYKHTRTGPALRGDAQPKLALGTGDPTE